MAPKCGVVFAVATASGRRAVARLAAGALLGLAMAVAALFGGAERVGSAALPDEVLATVNCASLRHDDYARTLAALANDRRDPLGDRERRFSRDHRLT